MNSLFVRDPTRRSSLQVSVFCVDPWRLWSTETVLSFMVSPTTGEWVVDDGSVEYEERGEGSQDLSQEYLCRETILDLV